MTIDEKISELISKGHTDPDKIAEMILESEGRKPQVSIHGDLFGTSQPKRKVYGCPTCNKESTNKSPTCEFCLGKKEMFELRDE